MSDGLVSKLGGRAEQRGGGDRAVSRIKAAPSDSRRPNPFVISKEAGISVKAWNAPACAGVRRNGGHQAAIAFQPRVSA